MANPIPHRRLGQSGLVVSSIALGTMLFGDRTDEAEAGRIFGEAVDAGVNLIDTADTYAGGRSEQIVGRLIAQDRHRFVLATKLANPNGTGPNQRGLSRKWILEEAEASLRRLGTDFIDILYLHKTDAGTPLEETARALGALQAKGVIRYFGVSNFPAWQIARLCAICDAEHIGRPVVSQPLYHALNRTAEMEHLPACRGLGLGVVPYSPVARGILSGKYAADAAPPEESRVALRNRRMMETEYRPENVQAAAVIAAHARRRGVAPATFAFAWVLANPIVTAALAGPRTVEQWRDYRAAADLAWSAEDEAVVDGLVRPGTTCVPQYTDPAYPPQGRPAAAS